MSPSLSCLIASCEAHDRRLEVDFSRKSKERTFAPYGQVVCGLPPLSSRLLALSPTPKKLSCSVFTSILKE